MYEIPWYRPITLGDEGADVKRWKDQMIVRQWLLSPTDIFTEEDVAACKQFQENKLLEVTGTVTEETWDAAWNTPIDTTLPGDEPQPQDELEEEDVNIPD